MVAFVFLLFLLSGFSLKVIGMFWVMLLFGYVGLVIYNFFCLDVVVNGKKMVRKMLCVKMEAMGLGTGDQGMSML